MGLKCGCPVHTPLFERHPDGHRTKRERPYRHRQRHQQELQRHRKRHQHAEHERTLRLVLRCEQCTEQEADSQRSLRNRVVSRTTELFLEQHRSGNIESRSHTGNDDRERRDDHPYPPKRHERSEATPQIADHRLPRWRRARREFAQREDQHTGNKECQPVDHDRPTGPEQRDQCTSNGCAHDQTGVTRNRNHRIRLVEIAFLHHRRNDARERRPPNRIENSRNHVECHEFRNRRGLRDEQHAHRNYEHAQNHVRDGDHHCARQSIRNHSTERQHQHNRDCLRG